MTKKIVCALVTALLCFQQAVAEENTNTFAMTGSVHDAVSPLAIAIADTGTESEGCESESCPLRHDFDRGWALFPTDSVLRFGIAVK